MTDVVRSATNLLSLLEPQNNGYANPRATVLQSQLARDLIVSLSALAGSGVLVDGGTYPFNTAGVQAAHDSLPAIGGTLVIPPNQPIQGSYTTLLLSRPNLKVIWPKSSPFLAPTGGDAYVLVRMGVPVVNTAVSSLFNANANHAVRSITLVSTTGFIQDKYVRLTNNVGQVQINRIREVTSATVLRLYRPISAPLTTAAVSVCTQIPDLVPGQEIDGLHIDNNGNSNPGLITGWVASASTTITANAAKGATTFTLTSAVGFATNDYILVRDSGQLFGEANGWITIATLAGAVVTTNGGLPFALNAATATIQNIGAGASIAQLRGNVGLVVTGGDRPILNNYTAKLITGSALYDIENYEPEYRDVIPYRCGFPYNGVVGPFSASIQSYYSIGQYWENSYSVDSLSWGAQLNVCSQPRGELGAVSPGSRGVKLGSTWDPTMKLWSEGGNSTGVAIANGSNHGELDVHANGNGDLGCWVSDQSNNDNHITFHGVGNNGGLGDIASGATDLRNLIEVVNEDAVIAFFDKSIITPKPYPIPFDAALYTADVGTWVLQSGDVDTFTIQMDGNVMVFNVKLSTTTVTGTPAQLRIALPGFAVSTRALGGLPTMVSDNGVVSAALIAVGAAGTTIVITRQDGANFANAVNNTYVNFQLRVEVN